MGDIVFFLVIAHVQQAGVEPNVKYVSRCIIIIVMHPCTVALIACQHPLVTAGC